MYRRILIGVDGSEVGQLALTRGLELSERFGASVTLLHAFEEPVRLWADPESVPHRAGMYRDGQGEGRALLASAVREAEQRGLKATARLVGGVDPVDAILSECAGQEHPHAAPYDMYDMYDVIVLGSHGRRGLERLMMGSVAEGVLRRAPCDVLIVKPPKSSKPAKPA